MSSNLRNYMDYEGGDR